MRRARTLLLVALAACTPDYDGTAFKCDGEHGCPAGQTCTSGTCTGGGASSFDVSCGADGDCSDTEICCFQFSGNARCTALAACTNYVAKCDERSDCSQGQACCGSAIDVMAPIECRTECIREEYCSDANDCTSGEPYCCTDATQLTPFKVCSDTPCS